MYVILSSSLWTIYLPPVVEEKLIQNWNLFKRLLPFVFVLYKGINCNLQISFSVFCLFLSKKKKKKKRFLIQRCLIIWFCYIWHFQDLESRSEFPKIELVLLFLIKADDWLQTVFYIYNFVRWIVICNVVIEKEVTLWVS